MSSGKESGISRRGFASMDKDRLKLVASQGGSSVKKENRYFSLNNDAAKAAAVLGGKSHLGKTRKKKDDTGNDGTQ